MMNVQDTSEIRELMDCELDQVNGGIVQSTVGVFLVGVAVGYGIRRGVDALVDWLF
jgi:hypothetical protein